MTGASSDVATWFITYNPAHHRFAVFLAWATFLLIVAGALVTSNDAGLSVPDWPTSFGSLYKIPPMVGGVQYEHTHRMIAEFIGLLIIVMAVWTQRVETAQVDARAGLDARWPRSSAKVFSAASRC